MRHAKNTLDREADARFWAQTGYKVGQKLDPTDPNDRHMVQVWIDVRRKVEAEDAAGRLRTTYDHPDVHGGLSDAETASAAAAAHLEAAASEADPEVARGHTEAAAQAATAASEGAARAAAAQPATVSPSVAERAAARVASEVGIPHDPITASLPTDHPALASPSAAPSAQEFYLDAAAELALGGPPRPRIGTLDEHLAAAQAVAALRNAVDAHAVAHVRPGGRLGTREPGTIDQIRRTAREIANTVKTPFLGVTLGNAGWDGVGFASATEAADWYGQVTDHPEDFRYVARFDRNDAAWPAPADELFGTGTTIRVSETPPAIPPTIPAPASEAPKRSGWATLAMVAGGIAAVGAAVVLASDAARRRRPSSMRVTVVDPRPRSGTPRFVASLPGGRR